MPETDPEFLLVRLQMDIGCALVDGVEEYLVDETDHRGIIDIGVGDIGAGRLFIAAADIQIIQVRIHEVGHGGIHDIERSFNRPVEFFLLNQHGLRVDAGMELELVNGGEVGRVGNGDIEPVAAFEKRQGMVLADELLADQVGRRGFHVHDIQIKQGHPEFLGSGPGDVAALQNLVFDQIADELRAFLLRRVIGLECLGFLQKPIHDQPARQAAEVYCGLDRCHDR